MLTMKQLKAIEELQQICEAEDTIRLKLNWDMLRNRSVDEENDFFYLDNGKLIAFLGLYGFGTKVELCGMVHPAYRRRGIFSDLFSKALYRCKDSHYREILLNAPGNSNTAKEFLDSVTCEYAFTEYQLQWEKIELSGMDDIHVRPSVSHEDRNAEIQLDVHCFGFSEDESKAYNNRIRLEEEQQFYIIEADDKTVGKIRVAHEALEAWIYGFAILPEYQGRGYGRKALKKTVMKEYESGYPIFLEVEATNSHALGLYESSGFRKIYAQDYYRYHY
ncbi:GNAT family N-acetyltransferase [Oceanobacillus saliphilus]|uniref:GNAT family N-acetyltransferase n=1 Tax=Oceanobacillus saliphilus TaxID=2925834 RepID=UPI00201DAFF7|nr:GNAT family N-acetyltransferase [Oceanobacillus saliphilus]